MTNQLRCLEEQQRRTRCVIAAHGCRLLAHVAIDAGDRFSVAQEFRIGKSRYRARLTIARVVEAAQGKEGAV